MAAFFFGDDNRGVLGEVFDGIYNMTPDEFGDLFSQGHLALPERLMKHLLDRTDDREVKVFRGLTPSDTYVYLWKGDTVEKKSIIEFSKMFLIKAIAAAYQMLKALRDAGMLSEDLKKEATRLESLMDHEYNVIPDKAYGEFSQPGPPGMKRTSRIRTYSVGIQRELEEDNDRTVKLRTAIKANNPPAERAAKQMGRNRTFRPADVKKSSFGI